MALAGIAYLIGESTDQLGNHLTPAATGIIQSAVGNLPELFVAIFALQAGLVTVVQASLVGSILSNALLVLGLAFLAGGWSHGVLRFGGQAPRMIASAAHARGRRDDPADARPRAAPACERARAGPLGRLRAGPAHGLRGPDPRDADESSRSLPVEAHLRDGIWPLPRAIGVLVAAGIAAAFVSEWFVAALEPAIEVLGISQAFAGLVIVAIAGNAVEHAVGIQLAIRGKAELAVSVVLNSALQVAVALVPILILVSLVHRRHAVHPRDSADLRGRALSRRPRRHHRHRRRRGRHRRRRGARGALRHHRRHILVGVKPPR